MGIMNIFRSRKKRRAIREQKELAQMCRNFKTLEQLQKSGLLLWDQAQRRLYLEQPIAVLMMKNNKTWTTFLQNCFYWIYYNECVDAMDGLLLDEELKAVRKAKKICNTLTMRDIQRIKTARRKEIAFEDYEKHAPEVKPFEFFVIRENSEVVPKSKNKGGTDKENKKIVAGGELLCVGQYDPDATHFDIALWTDVQAFLTQRGSKESK